MNAAQVLSIGRWLMTTGGTALGVHAAFNGTDTITIALGAVAPVAALVWSMFVHK